MNYSSIRLDDFEIENIVTVFKMFFSEKDHLWIFGSRVDPKKKGGDIDLYIETTLLEASVISKAKIDFLTELYYKIGEQKIDVVVNRTSTPFSLPIYEIAKEEGVQLV